MPVRRMRATSMARYFSIISRRTSVIERRISAIAPAAISSKVRFHPVVHHPQRKYSAATRCRTILHRVHTSVWNDSSIARTKMGETHLFPAFMYRYPHIEDNCEQPKRKKNVPCSSGFQVFPAFNKPPVPAVKKSSEIMMRYRRSAGTRTGDR